jgi:anti-anti-sigma factor
MSGAPRKPEARGGADRLQIQSAPRADGTEVRLSGDLTFATVNDFVEKLRDTEVAARGVLVLDLRDLRFLDSVALAALIAADKRSRQDGHRLVLITTAGPVERLLALTRLDGRLEIAAHPPETSER